MKKKLMMVAVLLGALTLGACVDDNESASVTAIREAKKAQLESLANLNNANAEAIALAAQAEADLKAAKAAYEQARADAEKANAAEQEMLNEQAKQEFALKLQMLQAKYAAKIAEYNNLKAFYENELWNNTDAHVQKVYNAYTAAVNNINILTGNKLTQQVLKSQTEAQLITAEESLKQSLASLNTEKLQKERELAKLTAMKEAQPSKDEYLKMLDDLEVKAYDILNNQRPAAKSASKTADEAYVAAKKAVTEGEYKFAVAAEFLNELATEYATEHGTSQFVGTKTIQLAEDEIEAFEEEWTNGPIDPSLDPASSTNAFKVTSYNLVASTLQMATLAADRAFEAELKDADDDIEAAKGEAWEDADEDGQLDWDSNYDQSNPTVNGATSEEKYYAQQITKLNKELSDLKKDLADAEEAEDTNEINRLKGEITRVEGELATAQDNKEDAAARILKANETLAEKEAAKKEIEELQKEYVANLAIVNDAAALKEYQDAIAALETPAVDAVKAQAAVKPYDVQLEEMGFNTTTTTSQPTVDNSLTTSDYATIKGLLDGIYDVQSLIDACNTRLAEIEATIELGGLNSQNLVTLVKKTIQVWDPVADNYKNVDVYAYSYTGTGVSLENAIALIDAKIKSLEDQITVEEARAKQYKEELNTLLGIEEETPAA